MLSSHFQALYFHLRTSKEDYNAIRAQLAASQKREAAKSTPQSSQTTQPTVNGTSASPAPAQSPSQGTPKPESGTPSEAPADNAATSCKLPLAILTDM